MIRVFYRQIWQTNWRFVWLILIPLFISVLVWLLNIQELGFFLFGGQVSFAQGLEIIFDSVFSVFTLPTDFTPIAFIIISVMQATAVVLLLQLRRAKQSQKNLAGQATSLGVAVIGAGCVACGGSLITPLLGLLFANISISLASTIGDILLMISIVLSYLALRKIAANPYFTLVVK